MRREHWTSALAGVIEGIAVALGVVAVVSVISVYSLGIADWFSRSSLWGHSLLRLGVAILLLRLHPGADLARLVRGRRVA